jgi:hypothetical protein
MTSKGHPLFLKISTAQSISSKVLIPVEMKVCRPSAATIRRRSESTIIADAILLYFKSNFFKKLRFLGKDLFHEFLIYGSQTYPKYFEDLRECLE